MTMRIIKNFISVGEKMTDEKFRTIMSLIILITIFGMIGLATNSAFSLVMLIIITVLLFMAL
jgi:hypothetical protein